MIQFSEALKDHDIEILVENATTYTAKYYSINDLRKGSGYNSPVDRIEQYDENNSLNYLNCYFENDGGEILSKGLFEIAKDLKLIEFDSLSKTTSQNRLKNY